MTAFTQEYLKDALQAIDSLTHMCIKSQEKLNPQKPQYALLENRIKAMKIASSLINDALSAI